MSLRSSALALVAAIVLTPAVLASVLAQRTPARPPNVVLIITDDVGYGDLGSPDR